MTEEAEVINTDKKEETYTIGRSKGWTNFFYISGSLGLLGIVFLALLEVGFSSFNDTDWEWFLIILATSLNSFFVGFLVNVFVDIRWLLSKLVEK